MNRANDNHTPVNAKRTKKTYAMSAMTCHFIGVVLTTTLLAGIYWTTQNRHAFSADQIHTQDQVVDATNLISDTENIRQRLAEMERVSADYQSKVKSIQNWLPPSIDFDHQRSSLMQVASDCELHWNGMHRKSQHDGFRLSVVAATCHVTGTLDQICLFLHKLPASDTPTWCNGVSIEPSNHDGVASNTCTATIDLRLPFVGQNTTAENLTRVYQSNAI